MALGLRFEEQNDGVSTKLFYHVVNSVAQTRTVYLRMFKIWYETLSFKFQHLFYLQISVAKLARQILPWTRDDKGRRKNQS